MVRRIRPYELFAKCWGDVTLPVPVRSSAKSQSVTLLETFVLIAAIRIVQPKTFLEIGTCRGATTLNLLQNTDVSITSVDIIRLPRDYDGTPYAGRVVECVMDSLHIADWSERYDMVFVDGDHTLPVAALDSANALRLADKCVVWHDYQNPLFPGLTEYIDGLDLQLYHVEETQLCFWFSSRELDFSTVG